MVHLKMLLISKILVHEIIVYYDRADKGLSNALYIIIIEQRFHGFLSILEQKVYQNAA